MKSVFLGYLAVYFYSFLILACTNDPSNLANEMTHDTFIVDVKDSVLVPPLELTNPSLLENVDTGADVTTRAEIAPRVGSSNSAIFPEPEITNDIPSSSTEMWVNGDDDDNMGEGDGGSKPDVSVLCDDRKMTYLFEMYSSYEEGRVSVMVVIAEDGKVTSAEVSKEHETNTGSKNLYSDALYRAKKFRFEARPGTMSQNCVITFSYKMN